MVKYDFSQVAYTANQLPHNYELQNLQFTPYNLTKNCQVNQLHKYCVPYLISS